MLALGFGDWVFWEAHSPPFYYGGQKCTFDGINKLIIVNEFVTALDIRTDVYSGWKEWQSDPNHFNTKYLGAIESTGGDPIPGTTEFTGDTYFLVNGWRLVVDVTKVAVSGVLFSATEATAYYDANLNPIFPARVAALVNTVSVGGGSGASAQELWEYNNRSLTTETATPPTVEEISDAIWNKQLAEIISADTTGGKLKALLTLNKYLGLS